MQYGEAPDWLKAADSHSVAENGNSIFSSIAESVGNAPKAAVVSVASGLNSIYNSGVAIANFVLPEESEVAKRDTADWIATFDDDLANYYKSDRAFFDTVGFIATSFIPGGLAIKGLKASQKSVQAAQVGNVGSNFSRATGLLVPKMETHVRVHAAQLASRSSQWKLMQANTLRTVASGAKQGVLEGAAFEAAVAATMFENPIFDDMDGWDMVKNMGIGIGIGGGIGGVFGLGKSYFGTKRLIQNADARQQRFATGETTVAPHANAESDNIIAALDDIDVLREKVTYEKVLAEKRATGEVAESLSPDAVQAEVDHLNRLRETHISSLQNRIRENIRALNKTKGAGSEGKLGNITIKEDMGNQIADLLEKSPTASTQILFDRAKSFTRLGDKSEFDKGLRSFMKEQGIKDVEEGKFMYEFFEKKTDTTGYAQLHSGKVGSVLDTAPTSASRLADKYNPKDLFKFVRGNKVANAKTADFTSKLTKLDAESRWIRMRNPATKLSSKQVYNITDLPVLEKAIRDGNTSLTYKIPGGEVVSYDTLPELRVAYKEAQDLVRLDLINKGVNTHTIEAITDIRVDFLEGASKYAMDDPLNYRAQASYAKELSKHLGRKDDRAISDFDLHLMPRFAKVNYLDPVEVDGHVLQGMRQIEYSNKLYQDAVDIAAADYYGKLSTSLTQYTPTMLRRAWRGGTGQGGITQAGGEYGSLESFTSYNAKVLGKIKQEKIGAVKESLEPYVNNLLSDSETAVRWSTLNEMVANNSERFVLNETGDALIPRKVADYLKKLDDGEEAVYPTLAEGTPELIPLQTENLRNLVAAHIDNTARVTEGRKTIAAVQGNTNSLYGDTFYPVRQDPRQFKHHAFIVDKSVSGVGHTKMILARNGDDLEKLITKVDTDRYDVRTSVDTDEYFKARDTWMYDRTLHENYLDIELSNRGIRSNYFPMTDPKLIADTFLQHHVRQEEALFREVTATKFHRFIDQMENLGRLYAGNHASSTDHFTKLAVSTKNNPYMAQVKNLFGFSRLEDAPDWWLTAQTAIDRGVTSAYNKVTNLYREAYQAGKLEDAANQANKIFNEMGLKTAYYDASLQLLANSKIDRGLVSKFVRDANVFLLNTILRLDPFNALNNKLGNSILLSSNMQELLSSIRKGDKVAAGDLAKLMDVKVPGVQDTIASPSKLIAAAYKEIIENSTKGKAHWEAYTQPFKDRALLPDLADQLYQSIDALTLTGATSAAELTAKRHAFTRITRNLVEKGARYSGNELAEEMNRMVAAVAAKKVTDLGVKAGVVSEAESWAYISNFVTRVNGVVQASERPLMFQGPIGQAMGLFQSYQMNLIANTLRNIGEGRGKTLALMAGMQTSIYGASSLPAFDLINRKLIGEASGNSDHGDIHSAAYTIFGKEGADWLMYGVPSNVLNASLYTRGNTNPRVWHIVPNPTNPSELPFINAFGTALSTTKASLNAVIDGAPIWQSILHGIEHSGLSRPLAGIASTARGLTGDKAFSTQRSGNILGENDLLSWATLIRIAGAKPIDEAIMQNNYYRITSYASSDLKKRSELGLAIRTSLLAGEIPDQDTINDFAFNYVKLGGTQKNFNAYFMRQYKNANVSQARQLSEKLSNPYARRMQQMMGGSEFLEEYTSD